IGRPLREGALDSFGYRYVALDLDRLDAAAAGWLLDALLPGLAEWMRTDLLRRAAGNPLFLELLAEEGARSGALRDGPDGRTLRGPLRSLTASADLSELVQSLLDSLSPEAHDLARAAAVIAATDQVFERWLLRTVSGVGRAMSRPWDELRETLVI